MFKRCRLMYTQLLSSISNLISKLFEFKSVQITNQTTTEIIDEKKDYKKAVNIAEKIINIAQKYKSEMTMADRLRFSKQVEKFQKYN